MQLRLPHARAIAADVLATARAQRWEPAEVVKALLTEETAGRARSMLASRRKSAGFPTGKTFDVWDPGASSIPLPTQQALQTLEWVQRRENLVVCGPAGTGKTFFLEALGQKVIEAGMPVAWFTLEQIGILVRAHRADDSLGKAVAKIVRAELIVIDDVGLLPVGTDAAEGQNHRVYGVDRGDHQASIAAPDTSIPLPRSAATFDNSKPSATPSHSLRPRKPSLSVPRRRRLEGSDGDGAPARRTRSWRLATGATPGVVADPRAAVAVGRSILVIIWHLLHDPDTRYHECRAAKFRSSQVRPCGRPFRGENCRRRPRPRRAPGTDCHVPRKRCL